MGCCGRQLLSCPPTKVSLLPQKGKKRGNRRGAAACQASKSTAKFYHCGYFCSCSQAYQGDPTPYLFLAYTSAHYGSDPRDGRTLVAMATFAAAHFFRKHYKISSKSDSNMDDISGKDWDLEQEPGAFWLAQGCLDSDVEVDEDGIVHRLKRNAADYPEAAERLANQDVSFCQPAYQPSPSPSISAYPPSVEVPVHSGS